MAPAEPNSGGSASGGATRDQAPVKVPSKDPKKKDDKKDEDLSEEDLALKQQLELYVERVQDPDPGLQKVALESMRQEIRTATSSMTSAPKPLKFLRPHYGTLQAQYEKMADSDLKKLLADILSFLALTMSPEGEMESLKYRLLGSDGDIGSWGHEYVRMADKDAPTDSSNHSESNVHPEHELSINALAKKVQESLSLSKRHKFWETQPVGQFKDLGDSSLPEGPIQPPTPLQEVKQEPYNLPAPYEWITCDIDSEEVCSEVYTLLTNNYVEDDENMFRFNYSKEFLRWALRPPGYFKSWHIGVRVKSSKKLVAFITAIPARIRVRETVVVLMAEVNFLCVHKKLRSKRLAPVMIKEVTRRVHLENIWQAAYTAGVVLPTPITTCQYWHRSLNPKKLIDVGFSRLGARMTMSRTIKLYKLPDQTVTPGFRKMEPHDVPAVTRLLRNYLKQFAVAPDFDENDVEHWLLPREDVVDSFLVESPENHQITDFTSFYTLPSSILGSPNHSILKAAYSYYNVTTKTPLLQLMNDALIVAKKKDFDVFNALDVMHNESFLKELKFGPGDGKLHYYLYNYRLKHVLKASELGLVLL